VQRIYLNYPIVGCYILQDKTGLIPFIVTRTGWDMDPFVVISFGKKVFRTRVIRHSLNPIWKEKLFFHVRQYESEYNIQFDVLDWDKLSGNDYVGAAKLSLAGLIEGAPKPDHTTGIYKEALNATATITMKDFTLPLTPQKEVKWETKHSPQLIFRYVHTTTPCSTHL
jgi:phosphatidylserine decarboxylase